jgi:hypothetical protein
MVFRCAWREKNLLRKYVDQEQIQDYAAGIEELRERGWNVLGLVCDGRKGLKLHRKKKLIDELF